MKKISIVCPCYNEEHNVRPLYLEIKKIFNSELPQFNWEIIFIDNASKDRSEEILRSIAGEDKRVKVIFNARNFGHIRSPYHALLQATGEAVILMASDFQDPPEMLKEFVKGWTSGSKVVIGVKNESDESKMMFAIRKFYYDLLGRIADVPLVKNFTGFGLYDQSVIAELRKLDDSYPYFRGLIAELGFPIQQVHFKQPRRQRGVTGNNFFTLYDMAMLGITSHSKLPLRLATLLGFAMGAFSLFLSFSYFLLKIIFWQSFALGSAPLLIGIFFFASVQLFFIGIIGEYIGFIYTQIKKRPLVIEKERLNYDEVSS